MSNKYTPWDNIGQLSIKAYSVSDRENQTVSLGERTTIYANGLHAAIIVVEFTALDKDGNTISGGNLPSHDIIKSATTLVDWSSKQEIGDSANWRVTTKSVYACPLELQTANPSLFAEKTTPDADDGTIQLKYLVTATDKANEIASTKKLAIQIKLGMITSSANSHDITSCEGSSLDTACYVDVINKSQIPIDALSQVLVYDTTQNDQIPTTVPILPKETDYHRAIHSAYSIDWDQTGDDDFAHNNRIFRTGIETSNPVYIAKQLDSKIETYDEKTIKEPCCFLDRSDGFYNYKGYLWPFCLVKKSELDEPTADLIDTTSNPRGQYKLLQQNFKDNYFEILDVFKKTDDFEGIDETNCADYIYISMYLTFGSMVQYFTRQYFYLLTVSDQYGNKLDLSVRPDNRPSIFDRNEIDLCGIDIFTDSYNNPVKWLSSPVDKSIPSTEEVGNVFDIYFWLTAANSTNWYRNLTMAYNYTDEDINNFGLIEIPDYSNFSKSSKQEFAFRTYRTEGFVFNTNGDSDAQDISDCTYKFTMLSQSGVEETGTLGTSISNGEYRLSNTPIYNSIPNSNSYYNWKVFPVWQFGCFITWLSNDILDSQNATLINTSDQGFYSLGSPNDAFDGALFSTMRAHPFDINQKVVPDSSLVAKTLDTGEGGPLNPYGYNPNEKDRGDWAAVDLPQLRWVNSDDYTGKMVFPNGLNQICLELNFNACSWSPNSTSNQNSAHYCKNYPTQDYVEKSIQLIDYETGNTIDSLVGLNWQVTRQPNGYCSSPKDSSFGQPMTYTNTQANQLYNYSVLFYISNSSNMEITRPLKIGVRFVIKDKNWDCPLIIDCASGIDEHNITPLSAKTYPAVVNQLSNFEANLNYYGDFTNNTNTNDDAPELTTGRQPINALNYNRRWGINVDFVQGANNPGTIIGWRNLGDPKQASGQTVSSTGPTSLALHSVGIYHNEFFLSPIGAFIYDDEGKTDRVASATVKVTAINRQSFSQNVRISTNDSASLRIIIVASFSGANQLVDYFPSANFEFYDAYGNGYPFSLKLGLIPMCLGKPEAISSNCSYIISLEADETTTLKNVVSDPDIYIYSSDFDHTIGIKDYVSADEYYTVEFKDVDPQSALKIVSIGSNTFATYSAVQFSFFNLLYFKYDKDKNDHNLWLGKDYTALTAGSYGNRGEAAAGYEGVPQHFNYFLLPVWNNSRLCFVLDPSSDPGPNNSKFLTILDDPNDSISKGVCFADYNKDYSILSLNIQPPSRK